MMRTRENLRLSGRATSPGLVIGKAFVYRDHPGVLSAPRSISRHEVEEEVSHVERAVEAVREDLQVSVERIEAQTGPKLAAIFEAHQAMLGDVSLRDEIRDEIERELTSAAHALVRVFDRWQERFRQVPNEELRERADDLLDLQGRLLREIAGVKTTALEKMPQNRVLVAHRLLPSETVSLPHRTVAGIILEFGGAGSHAALLARALGIPTVAQIQKVTEKISDEEEVIVDGDVGEVILNPNAAMRASYAERIRSGRDKQFQVKLLSREPARTRDGIEIAVLANIGSREDVVLPLITVPMAWDSIVSSNSIFLGKLLRPSKICWSSCKKCLPLSPESRLLYACWT
jgi:phosphoenolpyruvate-protein phosphotransferase (PTS system enzyme I)